MLDNDQSAGNIIAQASDDRRLVLEELSIPGATGQVFTDKWGINLAAARENFPRNGLQLYVPAWPQMGEGDRVRILLDSDEVSNLTIPKELVDQRQTLFVPPTHLQNGAAELSYRVKRLGQVEEPSAPTSIYVKLERPGGQDQDGSNPGHSELRFTLPEDVLKDGVDQERAKQGVEVTILPYPFMAEYDKIRLSWGGQFVSRTVTREQADNPEENPVVIAVEEAVILAAGDSDGKGLAIAFEVYDLVDNKSEDWSAEQRVVVDTGNARLAAGIVKEARNNVLDLEVLGDADATLQVVASGEPFAVGDSIVASLFGETEDGRPMDITYPPKPIESVPVVLEIGIANADVRQLAKTQAKFSYELVKSEASRQALGVAAYEQQRAEGNYQSRGQFVTIQGEAVRLAAPEALDAQQGTLDPALPIADIDVPWDDSMQTADVITLVWEGERPDLEPYFPAIRPHDISNGEVERKEPIPFSVDGKHLKAIEGGKLVLLYVLEREGQSPRRSERTITFNVGEPRAELPAPSVSYAEQQADGSWVLDPEKVPVGGTKLVVQRYARIKIGDVLHFNWNGTDEASLEDWIKITSTNFNREYFELTINKRLVADNDGHTVVASYWVERAEGGGPSYSEPLTLQVGAAVPALPELVIEEATAERVIDPALVANGATVIIGADAGLQPQDKVRIEVTGAYPDNKTHTVTEAGSQRFKIDAEVIKGNENSKIIVTYFVLRGGVQPEQPSAPVEFTVLEVSEPALPELVIEEATAERVIDPALVAEGATVFIDASAELQPQDKVRIEVKGAYPDDQTHPVETTGGQRFKIAAEVIMGNENSMITVTYFVLRGGVGPEQPSAPVDFTVLEIGKPVLPELVIEEATEQRVIDPARVADGATVFIDASAELQPQDKVRIEVKGAYPDDQTHPVETTGGQRFKIAAEVIRGNESSKITVTYFVLRGGVGPEQPSAPVEFTVLEFSEPALPELVIEEATEQRVIDPARVMEGATVVIGAGAGLQPQDKVRIKVTGAHPDDETHTVTVAGSQRFKIDAEVIMGNENSKITVTYFVLRGGVGPEEPSAPVEFTVLEFTEPALPDPLIEEADEEAIIDPERVRDGATLFIAASAGLQPLDKVRIEVTGGYPDTQTHPVTVAGAQRFPIGYSVIKANENGSIGVTYIVLPGGNLPEKRSGTVEYDVRTNIGKGLLRIFGARHNRSARRAPYTSRWLKAYQADTGKPVMAEWRYSGANEWSSAQEWLDTRPDLPLQVRTLDDQVTLNPANIIGNGIYNTATVGTAAFVALRNDGRVRGWGNPAYGGEIPALIMTLNDVVEVSSTATAYAVRRVGGHVMVWGNAAQGGSMGSVSPYGFRQVCGNGYAFAGIKDTGYVVTWGTSEYGVPVPEPINGLTDIVRVVPSSAGFAALRKTNQVVGWGAPGAVPVGIGNLTDIVDILGSGYAFAARRANGTVVAWGSATSGGDAKPVAHVIDIVRLCCSNDHAFVAQRATGHLVAWGTPSVGGTLPAGFEGISDIIDVVSTGRAFAAVRRNGSVVAWGETASGGTVPGYISELTNVVQVAGSSYAFAVLSHDGTVKAWGNTTVGGSIPAAVASELVDIQALYGNPYGFVALRRDGRVITWGHPQGGGDSSVVRDQIDTFVTYRATSSSRGRALMAQQQSVIAVS
ncbi:RCC1 domain-containing protein [Pseudomonas anuradhapurensis]